jgi:hypothetical protein
MNILQAKLNFIPQGIGAPISALQYKNVSDFIKGSALAMQA